MIPARVQILAGRSSPAGLGEAGEEDRAEGQDEAKQHLHAEQGPDLA